MHTEKTGMQYTKGKENKTMKIRNQKKCAKSTKDCHKLTCKLIRKLRAKIEAMKNLSFFLTVCWRRIRLEFTIFILVKN